MSRDAVFTVVQRAIEDEAYLALLTEQTYDALDAYDLDPSEQGALVAASAETLIGMGVSPEIAQRFEGMFRISRGGGG